MALVLGGDEPLRSRTAAAYRRREEPRDAGHDESSRRRMAMGFGGVVILFAAWLVVVWAFSPYKEPRESRRDPRQSLQEMVVRGEMSPHDFEQVRLHHVG